VVDGEGLIGGQDPPIRRAGKGGRHLPCRPCLYQLRRHLHHKMQKDLSLRSMQAGQHDVAQIRRDNALALFDEFVRNTVKDPDTATLRGLEGRFAERLQIQPSYWSQIKSRSRQIGERLARQFEVLCHKPSGWMDIPHGAAGSSAGQPAPGALRAVAPSAGDSPLPQDDEERFIVGLVLTYYRRHPQRARTRLLDLLGEVLMPAAGPADAPPAPSQLPPRTPATTAEDDAYALWKRTQAGVAPLKRKR
jgi:hypothetical protein